MKKCFFTEKGPKAIGPYCTATVSGSVAFLSGMLGIDPATGKLDSIYSFDGVHLKVKYIDVWREFLLDHGV